MQYCPAIQAINRENAAFEVMISSIRPYKQTQKHEQPEKIDQDISQNITFREQIKITYPKYTFISLIFFGNGNWLILHKPELCLILASL